ncbi:MAG: hypothetical protein ACOX4F_07515 [Atopobiaceae bacterium]
MIQQFVATVQAALSRARALHDISAVKEVEQAIGDLMELDPDTAMSLAPQSLVTMMSLAGTGDATAGYIAYALNQLSECYQGMGEERLSELRKEQAHAICTAFDVSGEEIPEEFQGLQH